MKHNVQESIILKKKAISRIRNCCHLLSFVVKKSDYKRKVITKEKKTTRC